MTDFRRFLDRSIPGERLINLKLITFASYGPGDEGEFHLSLHFVSGESLLLKGHAAGVVWGYLTAIGNSSMIVMGEEPNPLNLQELDS